MAVSLGGDEGDLYRKGDDGQRQVGKCPEGSRKGIPCGGNKAKAEGEHESFRGSQCKIEAARKKGVDVERVSPVQSR